MIIFTDGSAKTSNKVVISGVVCVNKEERIKSVFYCYKQTLNYDYQDNVHEFIAIIKAIEFANEELLHEQDFNDIIIINDSMQVIRIFNDLKKNDFSHLEKIKNEEIKQQLKEINVEKFLFLQLPRTTLGMNVVDFLNKEEEKFVKSSDSHYLGLQMRKLTSHNFDYNISSKRQKKYRF